jgi:hypothetical protein
MAERDLALMDYLTTPILIDKTVIVFKVECFGSYAKLGNCDREEIIYTGNVIVDTNLKTDVKGIKTVHLSDGNAIKFLNDSILEATNNCKERADFIFAAMRRC